MRVSLRLSALPTIGGMRSPRSRLLGMIGVLWSSVLVACGAAPLPPEARSPALPSGQTDSALTPAGSDARKEASFVTTEETPVTTPLGAPFRAPKGWTVTIKPRAVVMTEPDRDLIVAFVDSKERDLDKAIAAAWQLVAPGTIRNVKRTMRPPPRDGWDEMAQTEYELAAADERVVLGVARRKGDIVYIALLDGTTAAFGRREAQAMAALGTVTLKWVDGAIGAGAKSVQGAGAKSVGGAIFDARDWKSSFGIAKDRDGAERVVLSDPPYVGFDLLIGTTDGKPTLTLLDEQRRYVFTKR